MGADNRRHYREVKLVRVQPHDSRVIMQGKRCRRRRSAVLLAVSAALLFSLGAAGYMMVSHIDASASEDRVELAEEKLPEEILGEPAVVKAEDIVMLTEEEASRTPLIAIDPGHGGEDEGCSRDGVLESGINLELALRLSGRLRELGFDTVMIREDDETELSLEERVTKAENAGADAYISIHQNACEEDESQVEGIETWYYGNSGDSRRLAQLVHRGAVGKSGACDREVRETDELYVIREASMPSCLIETSFLSNREEREAIASAEYQDKLAAGIAQGIDLYFHPRTLYLTFDDGPSEENTNAILDILKARNIKATFFVVGENVRKHPETTRRIVAEGHTIGIHCYSHDYEEIYKSGEAYLEDFQKAYDTVYEITGVEVELFRFPGGSVNSYNKNVCDEIIEAMTEKGFIYFDWNASLEDAVKVSTPAGLIQNGVDSTLGRKKVVMLAHDIVDNTVLCLNDLLDSLPEYRVEPLSADVEPIQF